MYQCTVASQCIIIGTCICVDSLEKTVVPLVMELLEESETGKEMKLRIKSSEIIGHLAHELKGKESIGSQRILI